MKRSLFTFTVLMMSIPLYTQAKTDITVVRFEDKTEASRCPATTTKAKADLDRDLQAQLIKGLMELERFQIQQREIRKLKPEHTIIGSVRQFEVCSVEGRGQEVQIAIDVQLLSAKGGLTHMFSTSAQATSAAANRAPQMAMNAAIGEIIKRVDDAVPRRKSERLPMKRKKSGSDGGMMVKLVKRERR